MASFRFLYSAICLILLTSACSRKDLIGSYAYHGVVKGASVDKSLVLKKDSTFEYSEYTFIAILDEVRVHNAVGRGKFTLDGNKIILNSDFKIREINKVDVIPISINDLGLINKSAGSTDNVFLKFHVYFTSSVDDSATPKKDFYSEITVNGKTIDNDHPLLGFAKNKFPLELNLDFTLLSWPSVSGDSRFMDKKIKIEKAGNYKINVHLFNQNDPWIDSQILFEKRILPLTTFAKTINIDGMRKIKNNDKNHRNNKDE